MALFSAGYADSLGGTLPDSLGGTVRRGCGGGCGSLRARIVKESKCRAFSSALVVARCRSVLPCLLSRCADFLTGTLPADWVGGYGSELPRFPKLQQLHLGMNRFNGSLPRDLKTGGGWWL